MDKVLATQTLGPKFKSLVSTSRAGYDLPAKGTDTGGLLGFVGCQLGSRFKETPYLKGIRGSMTEQDRNVLWSPYVCMVTCSHTSVHTCTHTDTCRHTHTNGSMSHNTT